MNASPSLKELKDIAERTHQLEAEKAEKKAARLERKRQRELQKKRDVQHKFVAPILLMLTVLISGILMVVSSLWTL